MEFTTLIISILKGCWVVFFIFIPILIEQSVSKQRGPILQYLIWICTACLCPAKRMPGLYVSMEDKSVIKAWINSNRYDNENKTYSGMGSSLQYALGSRVSKSRVLVDDMCRRRPSSVGVTGLKEIKLNLFSLDN